MELSIDTASQVASVGVSDQGGLVAEITWRCRRNHTVELLPTIDKLLAQAGAAKEEIEAVFVCTGPGMYTGLRVGVSTAKGLASAWGCRSWGWVGWSWTPTHTPLSPDLLWPCTGRAAAI